MHQNAQWSSGSRGAAGVDLHVVSSDYVYKAGKVVGQICDLGVALEIPNGHVGLLLPRSSIVSRNLVMTNSVGVIDSDYRGSIRAVFSIDSEDSSVDFYKVGDRCAQLVVVPCKPVNFTEVENLKITDRGVNGFGSTGK